MENFKNAEYDKSYKRVFLNVKDIAFLNNIFSNKFKKEIENLTERPFDFVESFPLAIILNKKNHKGVPIHTDYKQKEKEWLGFIYLNKEWKDEYGGELLFWNKSIEGFKLLNKVLPLDKTLVLFENNEDSYHSVNETRSKYDRILINFTLKG